MTDPYTAATNVASGSATVGLQAETIHGDVHSYVIGLDASREKKYEVGVNYLNGGVPSDALAWIEQAMVDGLDSSELQFHRLLAVVSGRTSRQFSPEDSVRLDGIRGHDVIHRKDPWADGVRAVLRLLDSLRSPGTDPGPDIKALDDLHFFQRKLVLRHLSVFLRGPLGDHVWSREVEAAHASQHANNRGKRVGFFFRLKPIDPRAKLAVPAVASLRDRVMTYTTTLVSAIALLYIGWELVRHAAVTGVLGYVVGCAGVGLAASNWVDFRWRARRREAYARLHSPQTRAAPPAGGFAAGVDGRFDHFLWTNVPNGVDRSDWIFATQGVRNQLRDEIVEIYREQRVSARRLDWLIWYEVIKMKDRWSEGTFYSPADEFRATRTARITQSAGVIASILGVLLVAVTVSRVDALDGFFAFAVLGVSGYHTTRKWTDTALDERQASADKSEHDRKVAERGAAFQAHLDYLDRNTPTDQQMAEWLDCDRKILLEQALQCYGLKRSDVISYAFLESPGKSYSRARIVKGPWRYTRYTVLVFLLTGGGMRQVTFDLNTMDGTFQMLERQSYRYDAIAFAQVCITSDYQQTFDLHLVNGRTISLHVADSVEGQPEETDAKSVADATQDATGLRNTLRVLEGVSADGRGWIARETQLQDA